MSDPEMKEPGEGTTNRRRLMVVAAIATVVVVGILVSVSTLVGSRRAVAEDPPSAGEAPQQVRADVGVHAAGE
jgi:hypothetical protein